MSKRKGDKQMKKLIILFFVALIGISLISMNAKADNRRTSPRKHGVALGAVTVIVANGGTLFTVSGFASSSSCRFSLHDANSIHPTGTVASATNTISEGGEATQYDSFPFLDFGKEGLPFNNGLVVNTTTCDVAISYI